MGYHEGLVPRRANVDAVLCSFRTLLVVLLLFSYPAYCISTLVALSSLTLRPWGFGWASLMRWPSVGWRSFGLLCIRTRAQQLRAALPDEPLALFVRCRGFEWRRHSESDEVVSVSQHKLPEDVGLLLRDRAALHSLFGLFQRVGVPMGFIAPTVMT